MLRTVPAVFHSVNKKIEYKYKSNESPTRQFIHAAHLHAQLTQTQSQTSEILQSEKRASCRKLSKIKDLALLDSPTLSLPDPDSF